MLFVERGRTFERCRSYKCHEIAKPTNQQQMATKMDALFAGEARHLSNQSVGKKGRRIMWELNVDVTFPLRTGSKKGNFYDVSRFRKILSVYVISEKLTCIKLMTLCKMEA